MKIAGIYTITNVINSKMYVGYTDDFNTRKYNHFRELKTNRHSNTHLQGGFNKYGEENFIMELIEEYSIELLIAMEHYWATILNVHNRKFGYNLGATNPLTRGTRPMAGKKHTLKSREKISNNRKGKAKGENNHFYGKKHSEESKLKMSTAKKGIKFSKEVRLNMSKAKKGIMPKNIDSIKGWLKGKHLSDAQKLHISNIQKKKIYQYDKNMNFIKEFDSAVDACRILNFKNPSELTRCARGNKYSKTSHGYIWKYEKQEL